MLRSSQAYRAGLPAVGTGFGAAVAVSGDTIAIGAPDENGGDGAVYLFDRTSGAQRLRIGGEWKEHLGAALAVAGDALVAGAPDAAGGTGAAFVFDVVRGDLRLALSNPDPSTRRFGASLMVIGGDVVVGAPNDGVLSGGAVHVFEGTTGILLRTMRNPISTPRDRFGFSLAAQGTDLVIGAPGADGLGSKGDGAVFALDPATGRLQGVYGSPEPHAKGRFGYAVAADGPNILVGAPGEEGTGAAHLFDGPSGRLLGTLHLTETFRAVEFGSSVALLGSRALAAAPDWITLGEAGAAYVFDRDSRTLVQKLVAPEGTSTFDFGRALAAGDASSVLVSARMIGGDGDEGVVLRFGDRCGPCAPCESCVGGAGCARVPGCRAEVWCLGDSITAIYAPRLVDLEPTWRVRPLGQPVETSGAGLARLRVLLDQAETLPDAVVILYGTNDIGVVSGMAANPSAGGELAASNVVEMVTLLRERGIEPIVGLPIGVPHGLFARDDRAAAAALATGFATLRGRLRSIRPVVDFRLRRGRWYESLRHPNEDGALILAERARRAVRRVLRRRAIPSR